MAIESKIIALDDLLPDERNPRRHSPENIARLVSRIKAVGFTSAVLVDAKTGIIAAGHRRRLALHWLRSHDHPEPDGIEPGWGVPCRVGEWSELQALQVLLGDNGLEDELAYDDQQLLALLCELQKQDGLEGAGYSDVDLDRLIGELAEGDGGGAGESGLLDGVDPDDVPEDAPTRCKAGDLWALGEHRLLCGDSTDVETVERLMDGEKATMVFTDPPYGIAAEDVTGTALKVGPQVQVAYACCDWRSLSTIMAAMETAGLPPKACIVWDKQRGVQNLDRFHKQHEFIVYAGPYGGQKTVAGDVWQCARDFDPDHPTPKPVELVAKAIGHAAEANALTYDPFLGSGTTLIAAESLGRRCFGLELEPRYCDVILARYEKLTGKVATLLERVGD